MNNETWIVPVNDIALCFAVASSSIKTPYLSISLSGCDNSRGNIP